MKLPDTWRKAQEKHTYNVYLVGTGEGCYAKNYCREYVGTTCAISPEKACSNVRYQQMRDSENPNGGYSAYELGDYLEEGSVFFRYEAELVD